MQKGISVVVATYNGMDRIKPTLEHLLNQDTQNKFLLEIIVVDNNSSDQVRAAAAIVLENQSKVKSTILIEKKQGASFAKETGINAANYEYVCLCDDDNWLCTNYLLAIFNILEQNSEIGACCGEGVPVTENNSPLPSWFNLFAKDYVAGKQCDKEGFVPENKGFLPGAGLVFRKEIWLIMQKAKFTHQLDCRKGEQLTAGGDTELCYVFRLAGYKLWYCNKVWFKHFIPNNRLSLTYVYKLYEGFAQSQPFLSIYRALLNNKRKIWFLGLLESIVGWFVYVAFALSKGSFILAKVYHHYFVTRYKTFWNQKKQFIETRSNIEAFLKRLAIVLENK